MNALLREMEATERAGPVQPRPADVVPADAADLDRLFMRGR